MIIQSAGSVCFWRILADSVNKEVYEQQFN